jgi:hypoxanthine phosphoribosyltransferase
MVYDRSVDWAEFYDRLDRALAWMQSERFEGIVAVANGGILPGAILHEESGLPLSIVQINYRDHENKPRYPDARLLEAGPAPFPGKRVLLVDDVSRSGRTLARAREFLSASTVQTFLVNGKADFSLYDTAECLRMPWKRSE